MNLNFVLMFTVHNAENYPSDYQMEEIAEAIANIMDVEYEDVTDSDWEELEVYE